MQLLQNEYDCSVRRHIKFYSWIKKIIFALWLFQSTLLYDEIVNSRKYLSKLLDIANLTKKELVMIFLLRHLEARKLIMFWKEVRKRKPSNKI